MDYLRVLFVQHCAARTGSTISGRLIVEGFRQAGWDVDVAFGFDGPVIAEYERLGCRSHVVPHKNWLRTPRILYALRHLNSERQNARLFRQLVRDVRPDVVYVNSLVSLAGALAARQAGVPCVWHIRELFDDVGGEMRIPRCGGRTLVRRIVNSLATRRVVISQAVAENVLGVCDASRFDLLPNAVGDEFFDLTDSADECRRQFDLPAGVPVVGVPGTLRPVKGHRFFLSAAAKVARSFPDCVFALTGTGEPDYTAALQRQVHELKLDGRVRFLGAVSEMSRFYRACDVVCVPSVSESFGRTVIEAFAVGTPVIATAVGGMRETIEHNVTGLLVDYGDQDALSVAICRLLVDSGDRARLTANANRAARERYSAEQYQTRLLQLVRAACQSESVARREGRS